MVYNHKWIVDMIVIYIYISIIDCYIMVFNVLELFGIQIIQWLGGSDKRSVWGIQIPYIFRMKWGAN